MKTELKILRFLIENKGEYTIRGLSKKIISDYRITYIAVERLIKKNLLSVKTFGNSKVVSFTGNFSNEVFLVEFERQQKLLNNKNFKVIVEDLKKITVHLVVLVFGSYAKGNSKKHSDIDLMIIVQNQSIIKKIEHVLSLLPLKIHDFIFTEKEFLDMRLGKPNVVHEVVKNNVILYGIEQYYELLR